MDQQEFEAMLEKLARAWSTRDAQTAADCFADDIVYVEPPDRQRYVGKAAVLELSGGDDPPPMSMTWHHVVFDARQQIGFGEYTFRIGFGEDSARGGRQYHGVVAIQVRAGKIRRWREYQYPDQTPWTGFVGDSRFD